MNEDIDNSAYREEDEIDLWELFNLLWSEKRKIIKISIYFMLVGIFLAVASPKEYSANCLFLSQSTSNIQVSGSLSSLASLAGVNLNNMGNGEVLSPTIYPEILGNVNFQKELLHSKISVSTASEPIEIIDYYNDKLGYRKFNLLLFLKKYTVEIFKRAKSAASKAVFSNDELSFSASDNVPTLNRLTVEEYDCIKYVIPKIMSLSIDDKSGTITITANMPEPLAAANVAQNVFDLLHKYITEFKIEKAKTNMEFIQQRYEEAKADYEETQRVYAEFQDSNKGLSSAMALVRQEQIAAEYQLANTLYTELATQLLQANINVKEDTPVLTVIKPIVVPNERSKPKRAQMVIIWTLLGFIFTSGYIIASDYIKKQGGFGLKRDIEKN